MTSDVVSVAQDTPLNVVVQRLVDAHIHRVVVLGADRRLKGIVTSIDVMAALLRESRTAAKHTPSAVTRDF